MVYEEPDQLATPGGSTISELSAEGLIGRQSTRRPGKKERPMSMASEYDDEPAPLQPTTTFRVPRPNAMRLMSYLSSPNSNSDESGTPSSDNVSVLDDEALLAARRAQGRAMSLAALERAGARKAADDEHKAAMYEEKADEVSPAHQYKPLETPFEESYKLVEDSSEGSSDHHRTPRAPDFTRMPRQVNPPTPRVIDNGPGLNDLPRRDSVTLPIAVPIAEADEEVGDETILEDLVPGGENGEAGEDDGDWVDESDDEEAHNSRVTKTNAAHTQTIETITASDKQLEPQMEPAIEPMEPLTLGHQLRQSISLGTLKAVIDPQLAFMTGVLLQTRDRIGSGARSIQGSLALTNVSDGDSEIGQVLEAKKEGLGTSSHATLVQSPPARPTFLTPWGGNMAFPDEPVSPRTTDARESPAILAREPGRASPVGIKQKTSRPFTTTKSRLSKQHNSESDEMPELAPSVESDTGSSEGNVALESPRLPLWRDSFSMQALPQAPSPNIGPLSKPAGNDRAPARSLSRPSQSSLRNQADRQRAQARTSSLAPASPAGASEVHSIASASGDDNSSNSHETATTGQTHRSMLPSVRSKIAQLEGRQEALRRMSLASFGTPAASPRLGDEPASGARTPQPRSSIPRPTQPSPGSSFSNPVRARAIAAERSSTVESPHRLRRGTVATAASTDSGEDETGSDGGFTHRATVDYGRPDRESHYVNSQVGHEADDGPSSAASPSGPLPPDPVISPRSAFAKSKRKSYTKALAPRLVRTISDDTDLQQAEGTASRSRAVVSPASGRPVAVPSMSDSGHSSPGPNYTVSSSAPKVKAVSDSPKPARTLPRRPTPYLPGLRSKSSRNHLNRDQSTSSTSTTATQMEAALIARNVKPPRRDLRTQTLYVEGRYGGDSQQYDYEPYSQSPKMGTGDANGGAFEARYDVDKRYQPEQQRGAEYLHGNYQDPYEEEAVDPANSAWERAADEPNQEVKGRQEIRWSNGY